MMATRTEEVEAAERVIKDLEIRLRTYQVQIDALDKDIAALEFNEYVLQDNLTALKQDKIIALAQEYKKAKEELARVRIRLVQVTNERVQVGHTADAVVYALGKARQSYEDLKFKLDNNVLYGNFRKQTDGQA